MTRPYDTINIRITSRGDDNLAHNELPWLVDITTHNNDFRYVEMFEDLDAAYDFASNFLAPDAR